MVDLKASEVMIEIADPLGTQANSCINAYFQELQERLEEGFDPSNSVSAHPDELIPPAGYFWLAKIEDEPVGCVALKIKEEAIGEIKRMWVSHSARGLGIAQRLLTTLEHQAIKAGVDILQLDTHRSLTEARRLYERNGYVEIEPYNDNAYAHHWFEKRNLQARKASATASE